MNPLSREFLLERGFCCNLDCLNCPYKEIKLANIADHILGENSSVSLLNKEAYLKDDSCMRDLSREQWEEEEKRLEVKKYVGEELLYLEWIAGPLAAQGWLIKCDLTGEILCSSMLWIS